MLYLTHIKPKVLAPCIPEITSPALLQDTEVSKSSERYYFWRCSLLSWMQQEQQSSCSLTALGALQKRIAHPSLASTRVHRICGLKRTRRSQEHFQGLETEVPSVLLHRLCALAGLILEECLKKACMKTDSFAIMLCLLPVTMARKLLSLMWSIKCFLLKTNKLWECYLFPHLPLF